MSMINSAFAQGPAAQRREGEQIEFYLCCDCTGSGSAYDVRLRPAIGKELLHCVAQFAVGCESPEQALIVAEAGNQLRPVVNAASCIAQEGRNRSRYSGDGVHRAR